MTEPLRIEHDADRAGVWRFFLDQPSRANALNPAMVRALHGGLQNAFDSSAHAIVIASSAERFCAGFDLSDIEAVDDAELRERFGAIERLLELIRRAPALTIARVRGAALGAGADMVAACDYRIGSGSARLAFPGIRFGIVLGTRHLVGVVGRQRAREILIEGRTLDSAQALDAGLLSEVCEDERLDQRIEEIVAHAEQIDVQTLGAILRLSRDLPSKSDFAELMNSAQRPGLAERMRAHAQRAAGARSAARAATE